jgi:DcuC family C4-dicarboxylate transporter
MSSILDATPSILGILIIALAVAAIARRVDVRLVLLTASLGLASSADLVQLLREGAADGHVTLIVKQFLTTFADEKFVVPIGTAMGFAYVLRYSGCDQHLVHLLVRPIQRVRFLLIPGTVVVGFLVNIPIISQTSTAVTIGPVLIPLLQAARVSPLTTGAALLLGSSLGGELLNPGAPELQTVVVATNQQRPSTEAPATPADCVRHVLPLNLIHLLVATAVFWCLSHRTEKQSPGQSPLTTTDSFRVNLARALVPILPLVLLVLTSPVMLTSPPREIIHVPRHWLVGEQDLGRFNSRLIGAAMLIGAAVATFLTPRTALGAARAFFDGAGYAFTHIISLIVVANCFGKGVEITGLAAYLGGLIDRLPTFLMPLAGFLSLGFAALCGSGMASTQSLFGFFVEPARALAVDPVAVGAVVSLGAAAGRTMSPVAAVTLMCANLTGTDPVALARRVAVPLLVGVSVVVVVSILMKGMSGAG